jgi:hypothetical protein
MERKQMKIINLLAMLSFLLLACGGQEPSQNDVVGKWESPDGAEFIFNKDGTFTAKQIPTEFGYMPSDSLQNMKFNGSGKWEFKKENSYWKTYVDFDKVNVNKTCTFPLLISGESGVLENKPPWYLFVWKGEEGGERYKFVRK